MMPSDLFDHLGRPFRLGQQLGTGGEGAVFEIATAPDFVAKIYHKPPHAQAADKLRAMVGLAREDLLRVAAWPTATLHERPGGPPVGLMMRRIKDFKEIHTLYSPAHRKTVFPQADWRFLLNAAENCAAALANLHQCGVVVGDVNQSNVLVAASGIVALIDCDSFQVQVRGHTYPCEVGVPLFTPPELQNTSFRGLIRTLNHDRFGLAVLLFHLVFMGRHPFSGRFLGRGDMPIEKAIAEYRFAYGRLARNCEMQPPLHALPLSALSPSVADLFERAFGTHSSQGNARPTGVEWYNALKAFRASLRACPADPGHYYAPHLSSCPWCDLVRQGAPNFFISVAFFKPAASPAGPVFVLATVWARIEQVPRPNLAYQRPPALLAARPTPFPTGVPTLIPPKPAPPSILATPPQRVDIPANASQWTVGVVAAATGLAFGPLALWVKPVAVAFAIAFLLFGIWWAVLELQRRREMHEAYLEHEAEVAQARREYEERLRPWKQFVAPIQAEASRRRAAQEEAGQRLKAAESSWGPVSCRYAAEFDKTKEELRKFRQRHEDLAREYTLDRQRLQAKARDMQLEQFLQRHFISDGDIDGIGPSRVATLASFGIETASDIDPTVIMQLFGFKEKLTERLVRWRQTIEAQFAFDPRAGVPDHERALAMKYAQARQPVEMRLLAGERELRGIVRQAEEELRHLRDLISSCLKVLAQADLDLTLIPKDV
jgi:DNA-binding helix-hairpin-helix protein with protein kinase domain